MDVLNLIKKAEESAGRKYDFVIFARPDTSVSHNPNITQRAIQCEKSFFVSDRSSYQTRAAFEVYGNIWTDQFANPHPSMCGMTGSYEGFCHSAVTKIAK